MTTATQHRDIVTLVNSGVERLESIPFGAPVYNEIMHFLTLESRCLDDSRLVQWLDYLDEDMLYTVPIRQSVQLKRGLGYNQNGHWIYDRKGEITFKMKRVSEGDSGWSEDPASRSRRFFTSVLVYQTDIANEYLVQSNILVKRGRGDSKEMETLCGRRDDIVRRTDSGWKLARRHVLLDQTVLGMQNFAIFV
jgi:3-phenylpropionate/cinnamic acid dioxygenase small subunit